MPGSVNTNRSKLVTKMPSILNAVPKIPKRFMNLRRIVCASKRATEASSDRCELDSHADTCVAGSNTLLVSHDDRTVSVHPYSGEYAPIDDVKIGTVATLWVDPKSGRSFILIINEALYFGNRLPETLINPN